MNYRIFELDTQTWRIEEYDETTSVYMYLLTGEKKLCFWILAWALSTQHR